MLFRRTKTKNDTRKIGQQPYFPPKHVETSGQYTERLYELDKKSIAHIHFIPEYVRVRLKKSFRVILNTERSV